MRRDYFDVDVLNGARPPNGDKPVVEVTFDGPDGRLEDRLGSSEETLAADEIDVTVREKPEADEGVLSIANRLTGAFVLEANVDTAAIEELVETAKGIDGDEETKYRVRVLNAGGDATVFDKRTLLVYDADGGLLRQKSLIPGGVEL